MAANGLVIFAKDVSRLSLFYQTVLDATITEEGEQHAILDANGIELVVHGIPEDIATSITIDEPPKMRSSAVFKPAFKVSSLDQVRQACETLGGGLHPLNQSFESRGATVLNGWDPEGNVIQFKQFK